MTLPYFLFAEAETGVPAGTPGFVVPPAENPSFPRPIATDLEGNPLNPYDLLQEADAQRHASEIRQEAEAEAEAAKRQDWHLMERIPPAEIEEAAGIFNQLSSQTREGIPAVISLSSQLREGDLTFISLDRESLDWLREHTFPCMGGEDPASTAGFTVGRGTLEEGFNAALTGNRSLARNPNYEEGRWGEITSSYFFQIGIMSDPDRGGSPALLLAFGFSPGSGSEVEISERGSSVGDASFAMTNFGPGPNNLGPGEALVRAAEDEGGPFIFVTYLPEDAEDLSALRYGVIPGPQHDKSEF